MVDIKCISGRRLFIRDKKLMDEVADVLIGILRCRDLKFTKPNLRDVSVANVAPKLSECLSRRLVLFKGRR